MPREPFGTISNPLFGFLSLIIRVAGAIVFMFAFASVRTYSTLKSILIGIIGLFIIAIGNALRDTKFSINQVRRERKAEKLFKSIATPKYQGYSLRQSVHPFALLLRPFSIEGRLQEQQTTMIKNLGIPDAPHYLDFESFLANVIDPLAMFITLKSSEAASILGAARITSGDTWKEDIKKLGSLAKMIVVIPSYSPGILWEIDWLRNSSMLKKSIFVMPPNPETGSLDIEAAWKKATEEYHKINVVLPDYDDRGMFFIIDREGRPRGCKSIARRTKASRQIVLELLELSYLLDSGSPPKKDVYK
jgi:hypothetical protein